ncbi:fatty-acid amide hydrolase 2-B, partial [Asbolus verrucosus]
YISRITEVNPTINAVIENRFQNALAEAQQADDFVRSSGLSCEQLKEKHPLLGVPVTVKGSIAVAGMMHGAGRVDHTERAKIDATPVRYAKDAGAIPLLTSNVPELCMNWETTNKLIGTTANPYNNCRTPGGSSGGEASLIGCGASLIGIGSDIAGSLRLPAHCCGIWGHKPSPNVVSSVGHYPDCKNKQEWNEVFTVGPLARYAKDLKLLLSVIAEPNVKEELKLNEMVDVSKIKVYYIKDIKSSLSTRVDSDIIRAIEEVIAHFDTFCSCTEVALPFMELCAELSYLRLLNIDDVENLFEGKGDGAYSELLRFLCGKSIYEFTSICYGVLRRNLGLIPAQLMKKINAYIDKLRKEFLKVLGDDGVLIMPTNPCEAAYHGDIYRRLFNNGYCSIFNALGFPVTNCPIKFSKNGLPLGIQVVAARNMDRLTLSIAEEIEKSFGGWKFQ